MLDRRHETVLEARGHSGKGIWLSPSLFLPHDQKGFRSMSGGEGVGLVASRHHTESVEGTGWDCDSCLKDPLSAYLAIWDAKCKTWNGAFDHDCQRHWSERCIEARNFPLAVSCNPELIPYKDSIFYTIIHWWLYIHKDHEQGLGLWELRADWKKGH